jgi:inner membrane protein
MTGHTHDLAAFTTLTIFVATQHTPHLTLATAITAFAGNMMGGLMPDIDDATSGFWVKIPAGTFFGKLLHPLIGHHRMISHSLVGMGIAGYLIYLLLGAMHSVLLVDMKIVWWATMFGYASHLVMDFITKEGIPWFFPIPIRFGFPPLKFLRIRTGSWVETLFVFPGLIATNAYFIYVYYTPVLAFFRSIGK